MLGHLLIPARVLADQRRRQQTDHLRQSSRTKTLVELRNQPTIPSSVLTLRNENIRHPASACSVSTRAIFMRSPAWQPSNRDGQFQARHGEEGKARGFAPSLRRGRPGPHQGDAAPWIPAQGRALEPFRWVWGGRGPGHGGASASCPDGRSGGRRDPALPPSTQWMESRGSASGGGPGGKAPWWVSGQRPDLPFLPVPRTELGWPGLLDGWGFRGHA